MICFSFKTNAANSGKVNWPTPTGKQAFRSVPDDSIGLGNHDELKSSFCVQSSEISEHDNYWGFASGTHRDSIMSGRERNLTNYYNLSTRDSTLPASWCTQWRSRRWLPLGRTTKATPRIWGPQLKNLLARDLRPPTSQTAPHTSASPLGALFDSRIP